MPKSCMWINTGEEKRSIFAGEMGFARLSSTIKTRPRIQLHEFYSRMTRIMKLKIIISFYDSNSFSSLLSTAKMLEISASQKFPAFSFLSLFELEGYLRLIITCVKEVAGSADSFGIILV